MSPTVTTRIDPWTSVSPGGPGSTSQTFPIGETR